MRIVFNTSPLIFLSKLRYLKKALVLFDEIFVPEAVVEEIAARDDELNSKINQLIASRDLKIKQTSLKNLKNALSNKLGKGESEAIALAVELNVDFAILDDSSARKQALSLGLNVKGTLGLIKKLTESKSITIQDSNLLYRRLHDMGFWVDENIFNDILNDIK